MAGVLIIAHAPLASALKAVAQHTFPEKADMLAALDVAPEMSLEEIEQRASVLLAQVCQPDALIFTDVFGATPSNVAQRLAGQFAEAQVRVVTGVNVPMLWRSLCYSQEPAEAMAARAVASGTQGVMQLVSSRPQNQVGLTVAHDQDHDHHQQ